MKNKPAFTFILIILILLCAFPAAGQPDAARVREEVNKLARELNMVPEEPADNAIIRIIEAIFSFFAKLGPVLGIPILILFVFIIGFIGLRVFSVFLKERDKSPGSHSTDGKAGRKKPGEIFHHYLKEAENHAKNNKYGEALVLLHKGSIVFLQLKKILLAAEYHTNNEIRRELRNNKEYCELYYEPFSILAGGAERKTFRSEFISSDIYRESLEVYMKNFT